MFNQNLKIILLFAFFIGCSSSEKINFNKGKSEPNYFRFVESEFEAINPKDRFACLFPRFVNIDLSKFSRSQYPNPCSPPSLPNFVIFIPDTNSHLQINILTRSDSTISSFEPKDLQKGYYVFNTVNYVVTKEIKLERTKSIYGYRLDYFVNIKLNEINQKYKIRN